MKRSLRACDAIEWPLIGTVAWLGAVLVIAWCAVTPVEAQQRIASDDWPRFRGPSGSGVAPKSDKVPTEWTEDTNVAWKVELPGPGASSPIVVAGRVYVTCYSGYGVDEDQGQALENLQRHLLCYDLKTGDKIWQRSVRAHLPEDPYDKSGVSSHGYASHTPVADGERIYTFFGKGGVHAFDLNGNRIWQVGVGQESDPPRWGSSSSPVIDRDVLIVTASAESQSIIGLDKRTGQIKWQQYATGLDGMWGTPALVDAGSGRRDLVMMVAGEIWGLDPQTGMMRWLSNATTSMQAYTSIVCNEQQVFAFSGQGGGSLAVDVTGYGDVSATHRRWESSVHATYTSPIFHRGRLYVVSKQILTVLDAATGRRLSRQRLSGARRTGNDRFGSLDYASPVVVGDRLFVLNASGQVFVFQCGDTPELLADNEMTSGSEVFWGSPAVSQDRLVIRGNQHLYCIADLGDAQTKENRTELRPGVSAEQDVRVLESDYPDMQLLPKKDRPRRPARAPEWSED